MEFAYRATTKRALKSSGPIAKAGGLISAWEPPHARHIKEVASRLNWNTLRNPPLELRRQLFKFIKHILRRVSEVSMVSNAPTPTTTTHTALRNKCLPYRCPFCLGISGVLVLLLLGSCKFRSWFKRQIRTHSYPPYTLDDVTCLPFQ